MKRSRQKKQLKSLNPRRSPKGDKNKSVPAKRLDPLTAVLAFIALLLLILIFLMIGRKPAGRLLPVPETASGPNSSQPVIQRPGENRENRETPAQPDLEPQKPGADTQTAPQEPDANTALPLPEEPPEKPAEPERPAQRAKERTSRLFFVRVSGDGSIGIKGVLRQHPDTGSPLTNALQALLQGPGPEELSNQLLSLIPEDSRLLGARVEGGIAFLNFNEAFRFNALGIEGYKAQVEQVVFTATEFSTVDKVQFLIEGRRIDFLGGEGFWIGDPLGRGDF